MNYSINISILSLILNGIYANIITQTLNTTSTLNVTNKLNNTLTGCWSNNYKHCNHPLTQKSSNSIFLPQGEDIYCQSPLWSPCDDITVRCCGDAKCQLNQEYNYYYYTIDEEDDFDDDGHFYYKKDDEFYYKVINNEDKTYYNCVTDEHNQRTNQNIKLYSQNETSTRDVDYYYYYDDEEDYYDYSPIPKLLMGQCVPKDEYVEEKELYELSSKSPTMRPTGSPTTVPKITKLSTKSPTRVPTQSPTSSTSSSPTMYSTNYPSSTPSNTNSSCQDSMESFILNNNQHTCTWLGKKDTRRELYCKKKYIKEFCPSTCGVCCEDTKVMFTYELKSGKNVERSCEFLNSNKEWGCKLILFKSMCQVKCGIC